MADAFTVTITVRIDPCPIRRDLVERLATQYQPPTVVAASSGSDELEKLARLRDRGILTEREFQVKEAQILGLL